MLGYDKNDTTKHVCKYLVTGVMSKWLIFQQASDEQTVMDNF